jgi:hypothetical protein
MINACGAILRKKFYPMIFRKEISISNRDYPALAVMGEIPLRKIWKWQKIPGPGSQEFPRNRKCLNSVAGVIPILKPCGFFSREFQPIRLSNTTPAFMGKNLNRAMKMSQIAVIAIRHTGYTR